MLRFPERHRSSFIVYAQTEPAQSAGLRGSVGGDIYGSGYFKLEDGRMIQFAMTDSETVTVGRDVVKLENGRLIKVIVLQAGDLRIEQEPLNSPLGRAILNVH